MNGVNRFCWQLARHGWRDSDASNKDETTKGHVPIHRGLEGGDKQNKNKVASMTGGAAGNMKIERDSVDGVNVS